VSALDKIRAHGNTGGGVVLVPEWGDPDAPLEIHFRRLSLKDLAEAARAAPDNPVRQNVELFCLIAQTPDGRPLLRRIDALTLMDEADPAVLARVMREMGIVRTAQTEADLVKN